MSPDLCGESMWDVGEVVGTFNRASVLPLIYKFLSRLRRRPPATLPQLMKWISALILSAFGQRAASVRFSGVSGMLFCVPVVCQLGQKRKFSGELRITRSAHKHCVYSGLSAAEARGVILRMTLNQIEVLAGAIPWRFKSSRPHHSQVDGVTLPIGAPSPARRRRLHR